MARTVAQYKELILATINTKPELAGLSTSQVAEWVALVDAIAASQHTMESLYEAYSAELNSRGNETNVGTLAWYADKAKEFQYGDALVVVDGVVKYDPVIEANRVVDYVAVQELDSVVIIKVAALNGSNELAPIDHLEETALLSYMQARRIPGTRLTIVNDSPDLVKVDIQVKYYGYLILSQVKAAVELAINEYLTNIFFNGVLNINKLRDAIEAVEQVIGGGVTIVTLEAKPDGGSYSAITQDYQANSGYFKIDPAYPLSSAITYVAV